VVRFRPPMAFHQSAEAIAHFQQWLDRLARPIEFASRNGFAHLPTVKNLSSFVSSQVLWALSDHVYPKSVEAGLLKLRTLFSEDQARLPTAEQERRLLEAAAILRSLREAADDRRHAWQVQEPVMHEEPPSQPISSRDVGVVPIRFAKGVGPKRSSIMQRLGIETVEDALWTVPWRYEDRSVMTPLGDLVPGMVTAVCGTVAKRHDRTDAGRVLQSALPRAGVGCGQIRDDERAHHCRQTRLDGPENGGVAV
jgi:ATP-dependent DNA helicase RecG